MKAETLGDTMSNVEAKILFDALADTSLEVKPEKYRIHIGRCNDQGTN